MIEVSKIINPTNASDGAGVKLKRSILDYMWQPMAKVKERAFTD